jgi:nucleotide-binding universal stress UspA family protein
MFKKILFATTASPACDNAAKVAFDLEMKWDAQLCVFHVLGVPSRGYSSFVTDVRTGETEQIDPDYVDWVKEEMKHTYADLLKDSENSTLEAVIGVPHREILRKARAENVDLIVMGAHTRDEDIGAARYRSVVGSTMQKWPRAPAARWSSSAVPVPPAGSSSQTLSWAPIFPNRQPVPSSGPPDWPKRSTPGCTFFMRWISAHPSREK